MKILSFFSRATIILFLQICFVTSLTISFCEPVFAAKSSKKKKSKKKSKKKKIKKKKSKKQKRAAKKKAEKKQAEKEKVKKKDEIKPTNKPEQKSIPRTLTRFETENTYWCGSVYCDKANDDDDAACLLSPGDKPMKCIYGNIKINKRDASLKKLKTSPEEDSGMEMCLYELHALCGGFSASFNNDKDMVSAECEKNNKMYKCLPAFENVPKALADPTAPTLPLAMGTTPIPQTTITTKTSA